MLLFDLRIEIRNISTRLDTILRNLPSDNEISILANELYKTTKNAVDYLDGKNNDSEMGDVMKLTEMVNALDISSNNLNKKILDYKKMRQTKE